MYLIMRGPRPCVCVCYVYVACSLDDDCVSRTICVCPVLCSTTLEMSVCGTGKGEGEVSRFLMALFGHKTTDICHTLDAVGI